MSCAYKSASLPMRRGFTLVELLVVVAIIALLVSILLPTLGMAKALARTVKCSSNLHTIARGAHLYATEYNDYIPRDAAWNPGPYPPGAYEGQEFYFFAARFSPYVGGPKIPIIEDDCDDPYLYDILKNVPVYVCPSIRDKRYVVTYVSNGWNFRDPTKSYCYMADSKLSTLTRPAAGIGLIMELNPHVLPPPDRDDLPKVVFGRYDCLGKISGGGDLVNYDLTFDDNGDLNPNGRMIRYDDNRHYGRTTIVFFDGHAEPRRLIPKELPASMFFPHD